MMTLPGTLAVRSLNGRYGQFNIGSLNTEIGKFTVKDRLLEELSEGRYQGDFVISQIAASHYATHGRLVMEVRAFIDDYQLKDQKALPKEEQFNSEQDPAEQEKPELKQAPAADSDGAEPTGKTEGAPQAQGDHKDSEDLNTQLKTLFGEDFFDCDGGLIQPPVIKLDATVDRILLRQQSQMLQSLGYINDYKAKAWKLKDKEKYDAFVNENA
jgi:Protein of unknown function (DUF3275)